MSVYNKHNVNRINRLLNGLPLQIICNFKYDIEGLYSFTKYNIGIELAKKILSLPDMNKNSIVIDIMSSIGGNTIPFAQYFSNVIAIESNANRHRMLQYNLKLLNLNNVKTYCDYYQNIIHNLKFDCVFFDPPWGSNYKKFKKITITIHMDNKGFTTIENVINSLKGRTKYVMIKLPINYDMEYFMNNTKKNCSIVTSRKFEQPNSMIILILKY